MVLHAYSRGWIAVVAWVAACGGKPDAGGRAGLISSGNVGGEGGMPASLDDWFFDPADDSGDGIADRILISGKVWEQGLVSSDYASACGEPGDEASLSLTARLVDEPPPSLTANDDPLGLRVYPSRFLASATAELATSEGERVVGEALVANGLIYGFAVDIAQASGSAVVWNVRGTNTNGTAFEPNELEVEIADWGEPVAGDFESIAPGAVSHGANASIGGAFCLEWADAEQLACNSQLPPLEGNQSLWLDGAGAFAAVRLARPPGTSRVTFVTTGRVGGRVSVLGSELQSFSSESSPATHSIELDAGDEVLLEARNHGNFGVAGQIVGLDAVRFE